MIGNGLQLRFELSLRRSVILVPNNRREAHGVSQDCIDDRNVVRDFADELLEFNVVEIERRVGIVRAAGHGHKMLFLLIEEMASIADRFEFFSHFCKHGL